MKKKIIITGATGLIGKETIPYLLDNDFEIYAITKQDIKSDEINWIKCDLFDLSSLEKNFQDIKPQYLLHFAWITGNDYLTNEINIQFLKSSKKMLEIFRLNGGKKAMYAGTCFEYDMNGEILKESTPLKANSLYEKCKIELHNYCMSYSKKNNIDFIWGRIFYVYGHNEKSSRLTASILDSLKNNKEFYLKVPNNALDYMYSKEIARAFVDTIKSNYCGDINICSGKTILLKDYALTIQELLGKKGLIKINKEKTQAVKVLGDNSTLKNTINFKYKYSLESALKEIISDL